MPRSYTGGGAPVIGPSTSSTFTAGSVIFAGASTLSQNNTKLFWDDTSFLLKVTGSIYAQAEENNILFRNAAGSVTNGRIGRNSVDGGVILTADTATLTLSTGGGATNVNINAVGAAAARFDNSSTATQTRFLVYDVDNGQLERVTVGAADSGGAGFKVLRIPN